MKTKYSLHSLTEQWTIKKDFPIVSVSQITTNIHITSKYPHIENKRQIGDIQHSTRLHNNQIRHQSIQRHTSTDKTGEEEEDKRWLGVSSSPSASGSTFFVGNRPVKVCKKLALSVCEDMRLPQRSMAYEWDEWNGDSKVSGGATREWGCTFFLSTQAKRACWVTQPPHTHTRTLLWSVGYFHTWRRKTTDTGQGHSTWKALYP